MNTNWMKKLGLSFLVFSLLFGPVSLTPAYALDIPTLIAPTDGITTTAADTPPLGIPEFTWEAVSGATNYRVQISNDIAFTSMIVNQLTPNTSYTPSVANTFPDGVWYWRVRVESPAPIGVFSTIWSFTKQWAAPNNFPALSSPADFATLDFYDHPVFSWGPVTGAAKYKLQIYSSPGGWATLSYTATTLVTTHQPALKLTNGTYYWRVVPVDIGNRDGTPSQERSFNASYNPVPTLLEPVDGATPTFTPTFRWTAVRGAQSYRLQYTTDSAFSSGIVQVDTNNTVHTPINTLPNDINYYWRVRVFSGSSSSDWSPINTFIKRWYIKPVTLTPTNNYQYTRFPLYSWTPVPGAAKYLVEISKVANFSPLFDSGYTANTFFSPNLHDGAPVGILYYWRVTPYDGNNNKGKESITASYSSLGISLAPHQVYPLFYYPPNQYQGFPGVATNPYEDRTVATPIFIWHRVYIAPLEANEGEIYADAYRLQVSTDPTFASVTWSVDTENQFAVPTASNPFSPLTNTDYFWRVRPLIGGSEAGQWSQVWKTRFDPARGLTPIGGSAPSLIRPTAGFEFAEMTPLLEWFPLSGASAYDVQISQNEGFSEIVDSATVPYSAYAPTQSLAQRNLGDVDFGVYYWRVRQSPSGAWSEVRRFQVAAQSQWKLTRTLANAENRLQIGSDPSGDIADADYGLTTLQAAQSGNNWYFGFHVPASPTKNITYALYLDLDHQQASGATSDARSYNVTTISAYRPEYAIYILQEAGAYSASKAYLYRWTGSGWDTVNVLGTIGGSISYSAGYVEVQIPNTAIGYQDDTGSYAISLFSLPAGSGQPQDSVPSDLAIPGSGPISRFANVTERMNLLAPPNDAGVDPSTVSSVLPFFWDWSILARWSGAIMKAYLDPQFTSEAGTYTLTSNTAYFAQTSHAWDKDFTGDNTYYWRIQPRYRAEDNNLYSGVWSQGWRFERLGFIAQNLTTSVTSATPTFSWDMVEGAEYYNLQVSTDPGFGSPVINVSTRQNSYTNTGTLANATYYWRVQVRRNGNVGNNWTPSQSFTLSLPTPTGLTHIPSGVATRAPTLCWTPVMINSLSGDPVFAAWKYRVQVSKEPSFSTIFDTIDSEQSCWTPIKGYDDGQYYWRIAVIDGQGKFGNYSAAGSFTKQYPTTTLVSPSSGASLGTTPTFVWTPVNGAAKYKFEASQFSTFSPVYDTITTDNVRWTPTKAYASGITYYWRVAIVDNDGKIGPFVGATIIIPTQSPTVVSITRINANPTNLSSVQFSVGFSKAVTGVSTSDFAITKTGSITGSSISSVTGSGTNYTVTVLTGSGSGTLRLDIPTSATIVDTTGNPLIGLPYTGGEVYTVLGPFPSTWIGGVSIASDQNVVAVARPHLGSEVASYIGSSAGSTTQYVPMLFKGAFGGTYNAALYLQNVSATAATLNLEFTNSSGTVVYTKADTLDPHASKGYWLPTETGLPNGFAGGVKVTSTQPILAVGRPHIGTQVMTYNGMSSGATTAWLPMFFKNGFSGSYNTALYVQNVTGSSANLTIQYINLNGTVACTDNDTLGANASKGYWSLAITCDTGSLPSGFVGGVKVTSTQNILAVGRAHLGTQITTYNGFPGGATSAYVPMLFKNAFSGGSYDAALYLQNVSGSSATVTIEYLNSAGTVAATQNVTLAANAISSIWLPTVVGLPDGFAGGARVTSTQNVIAIGRPHLGSEITTYNGAPAGSLNAYLPMLFKDAYGGGYDAAFYVQNTSGSAANVEISFYDSAGVLSCVKSIDLTAGATAGFWMPTVTCTP